MLFILTSQVMSAQKGKLIFKAIEGWCQGSPGTSVYISLAVDLSHLLFRASFHQILKKLEGWRNHSSHRGGQREADAEKQAEYFNTVFLLDADAGCGCSWSNRECRSQNRTWRGEGAWWILRSLSTSLNTLKRRQNTHCTLYMHIIFLLLAGAQEGTRSWPLLKESALLRDDDCDEDEKTIIRNRKPSWC